MGIRIASALLLAAASLAVAGEPQDAGRPRSGATAAVVFAPAPGEDAADDAFRDHFTGTVHR